MPSMNEKQLRYMEYLQRENGVRHHTTNEDEYQYQLLKAGDPKAGEETLKIIRSGLTGHVSHDPVRNAKYIFVAGTALASRAAMSAGLESERANNVADYYILKMDGLRSVDAIQELQKEMMEYFAHEVAEIEKKCVISRDISNSLDYIYEHLHEPISVEELSEHVGLSRSYFSTLFKNEMGISASEYIVSKRIEAAKNMLRYSPFSYSMIAATLAFSTQSHFIRVFKKETGLTPHKYRKQFGET